MSTGELSVIMTTTTMSTGGLSMIMTTADRAGPRGEDSHGNSRRDGEKRVVHCVTS